MSSIKHIVFDVGNVLVCWDPERAYLDKIPDAGERRWFLDHVCTPEWNMEQDRGRSWAEAEEVLIAKFPDQEDNIRWYRANWVQMVQRMEGGSVEILEKLAADGRDITFLTNFAADTWEEETHAFEYLRLGRGATVSGRVGLVKPDREIYDHHIKAFDLDAAATLFIDDNLPNVEAARLAGWQAVRFTDADALRADLTRFGLV